MIGGVGDHDDFAESIRSYWAPERVESARRHLREYYSPATPFTGSMFEVTADREHPNEITARDLVAVSMLGVNVPADVAIWILSDEGRARISELLREVPTGALIREGAVHLGDGSPMWQLWDLLDSACWPEPRAGNGMGQTLKSKLLAAKRPGLVPVVDSVVRSAHPVQGNHYWAAFTETFDDATILEASIHLMPRPEQVPVLRALDVVIWQTHRHRA